MAGGATITGSSATPPSAPDEHPGAGQPPAGARVTSVRVTCGHALALTSTGTVLAWGSNQDGRLGTGTVGGSSSGTPSPVRLPDGTIVKATSASAGSDFSLAMTANGGALSWGANFSGQLGNGRTGSGSDHPVRVKLPKGTRLRGLIAGCAHALALNAAGKVLAWGLNQAGQLGDGANPAPGGHRDTPVKVRLSKGTTVRAVSAGCEHSLALTTPGQVLARGLNGQGQLGQGGPPPNASSTPARVKLPAGVTATAIGSADAQSSFAIIGLPRSR